MYSIYAKTSGCIFCDRAKQLLDDLDLPYTVKTFETLDNLREELDGIVPKDRIVSFPLIFSDGTLIGGFTNLRDTLTEPILRHDAERFAAFPVKYPDLYALYKKHVASFWTSDEISLADDAAGFEKLTDDERRFLLHVLAFFSQADGIVLKNINMNFQNEVKLFESKLFYSIQGFMEAEHSITYAQLIDGLVTSDVERDRLLNAIEHVPGVKAKATWAQKWLDPTRSFAERLVAFACVEGILFSGSFCAIFWLKTRTNMPGLSLSNQFIARDEKLHVDHAVALFKLLRNKPSRATVQSIVKEAVENEILFISDALPARLVGMNKESMQAYIEFVADSLLADLGYDALYGSQNPFSFMQTLGLEGKTNFFESRASEYARAGVLADESNGETSEDDDF
jgi:ribonucleotide reductase beta subunit family protein with ferritin-like domain